MWGKRRYATGGENDTGSSAPPAQQEILFDSPVFVRRLVQRSARCKVVCDALPADGIEILSVRLVAGAARDPAVFSFGGEASGLCSDARMGTILTRGAAGRRPALWHPRWVTVGRPDQHGRLAVVNGSEIETWWELGGSPTLHLKLPAAADASAFWSMVVFDESSTTTVSDILDVCDGERERLIKSDWFDASSVADFWKYLADGAVYDPRDAGHGRFRCQQCAYAWWSYLMALHRRTSKPHYRALARWVAWSVLVDQADDGSWRHGFLEAEPEIHSRFFWDGVRLLLEEHTLDPQPELLEAARQAGTFALEHLSEELGEGRLWFLHDSIEGARELRVRTPVLGRSARNSLCLNTHVQALNVLQRLASRTGDEPFVDAYRRGRDGLIAVLAIHGGNWATAVFHRLLPAALVWKVPTGFAERVLRFLLYRVGAGAYWWVRGAVPGLVFGNGYLDRDLGATMLADEYHVINLKDLLELHNLDPELRLRKVIEDAAGFASSLDFSRCLARSPIWSEWADVLEVWASDLIDLDVDRESVAAEILDQYGASPLDAFCQQSGLELAGTSGGQEASDR